MIGTLIVIIIFIADIWAFINIRESSENESAKVNWVLVVALLPVVGLLIWYVGRPRRLVATWRTDG